MADLNVGLPEVVGFEDALAKLVRWLRDKYANSRPSFTSADGFTFPVRAILQDEISEAHRPAIAEFLRSNERPFVHQDLRTNAASFHDAAWELVRRGILTPSILYQNGQPSFVSDEFRVTAYGEQWLAGQPGFDIIPSEYSRFSTQLAHHNKRFGPIYVSRSQEALGCYRAALYLACCAMCGAAAEAVALALAIARSKDEEGTVKLYRGSGGTGKILKQLLFGRSNGIQERLTSYFELLSYWRNDAAHAFDASIDEGTAFTAMLLLLRFAHFADTRWAELTS